jgi:CHAD domain-containing protein
VNHNLTLIDRECTQATITLADYIYPAIQKQYVSILTLEAKVLADKDVAAIHQMRVSLRRLKSQIQAFGSVLDIPKVMGEKQIGKIAKVLGKVRDLDVLYDTFKIRAANLPDSEQIHLEKVTTTIVKRRRKEILKVKLLLNNSNYQYFKLGINNWLNHPQYLPITGVEIGLVLPELLLQSIGKLFVDSSWWLDLDSAIEPEVAISQLLASHGDIFHDFRKQVKATRYLMEIFVDRYPAKYQDYIKDLKQIHQLFGDIQDNIVLDDYIRKILGERAPVKLPTLYDQINQTNYLNWQKWQPIQHRYRWLAPKQEFQLLLIQDIIRDLHG